MLGLERRIDPLFRPAFDRLPRGPLASLTTWLINLRRKDEGLGIAEERTQPDEEAHLDDIGPYRPARNQRSPGSNAVRLAVIDAQARLRSVLLGPIQLRFRKTLAGGNERSRWL
jgi:hypothetical protein